MGEPKAHSPVILFVAVFSRYSDAIDWARHRGVEQWGPTAVVSEPFPFDHTDYYRREMGMALTKQLFAFLRPIDPARLAEIKLLTNAWEDQYASAADHGEPRPVNIDPGYVTPAKLVLATTKDRQHRLYLGRGIFAEVTLSYARSAWQIHEWTYPDYRTEIAHRFLTQCRALLGDRSPGGARDAVDPHR